MQQEAFLGEDILDRPPPEESVPGLLSADRGSTCRAGSIGPVTSWRHRLERPSELPRPPSRRTSRRRPAALHVTASACSSPPGGRAASSTVASVTCRSSSPPAISSSSTRPPLSPRPCPRRAPTAAELELRLSTPAPGRDPGTPLDRGATPRRRSRSAPSTAGERARAPWPARPRGSSPPYAAPRLWLARPRPATGALATYLAEHGHPIRYRHVPQRWPLSAYQTVYAAEPGSAEMPSAGRPFTARADHPARRKWRACRADHAAHRRLLAGAPRASVPRTLPRSAAHGEPGERRA